MTRSLTARAAAAATSVMPLALVLPAAVFLLALIVRALQPIQHQPAAAAVAVLALFAGRPRAVLGVLLLACPCAALVLAAADQWRRWRDDAAWRSDVALLAGSGWRVLRRPLAVVSALALLASAAWLALVVVHVILG